MNVRRIPPVDIEVVEALHYYRAIEPKLAERLTAEFEACIARIVQAEDIVIIAFASTHRRPGYWRDRLAAL